MNPKKYALIGGIVMLALGILSFIPSLSTYTTELIPLNFEKSYGMFFGIFPMNLINKVALILFGAWGLRAATMPTTALPMSVLWSRVVFFVMGAGAILGMIPQTQTFFGSWPLYGNEVYLHAFFAALGAYFGFALTTEAAENEEVRIAKMPKFQS